MRTKKIAVLVFLALVLSSTSIAQPVIPDSTFNGTGRNFLSLGVTFNFGDNIALQTDGKIIMSGGVNAGGYIKLGMTRLNIDGTTDPTFGTAGITFIDCGTQDIDSVFDPEIVIRPDGKILVCGYTKNSPGNVDFLVCRLLANGQPDNTFGTAGRVVVDIMGTGAHPDTPHAITTDTAGNIMSVETPVQVNWKPPMIWQSLNLHRQEYLIRLFQAMANYFLI
jgi:uncharacterized delta-60 repeat protein